MSHKIDTVAVGGGQAGLAISCYRSRKAATMLCWSEGGVLQGTSRALGEEITWEDRKVTSTDWQSYNTLPHGMEVPVIQSVLIDRPAAKASGAAETAITLDAAAIGNSIFDATGARIREVPFTPDRVKAALSSHG